VNLVFDIETNGLLHDLTTIHCIGIHNLDTKENHAFNDVGGEPITRAIAMLEEACHVVGHNIINFDIPAINSLYPFFCKTSGVVDTLLLSRLYKTNLLEIDKQRRFNGMPEKLYSRHSLEAYGYRLGTYKGTFGKETDWSNWSQEMQDYMMQDVAVTTKLWMYFQKYLSGSN